MNAFFCTPFFISRSALAPVFPLGNSRTVMRLLMGSASGCALRQLLFALLFLCPPNSTLFGADIVQATIEKDTAWTGEPVPLIITLYSPGPFSGAASFELPELPRTATIKVGNPVVGSEEVDGVSYLTQRHEFRLYTQQTDEFVLPPFQVRYSAKQTFTSAPEPRVGTTPELRFRSNRPPGTESLGVVVAVTQMNVSQNWLPENSVSLEAGDVIERTVTRQADGTTAMMLPPVPASAPDGVRVYETDPIVQDKTERGASTANRVDTIKYQFERAGTFDLPAIEFVRWDPQTEELKRELLPGITVSVDGAPDARDAESINSAIDRPRWPIGAWLAAIVTLAWLCHMPVRRILAAWQAKRNSPETVAARRVVSACRTSDPSAAYSALLDWQRVPQSLATEATASNAAELEREFAVLSSTLFGANAGGDKWSGKPLLAAFTSTRRELTRHQKSSSTVPALPTLNPT